MKEFNLQEYLANPSQKIMTRDGRKVRILCTDVKNEQPVLALVIEGNREDIHFYYQNGVWCNDFPENRLDLFFVPIKKEGWINLYRVNYDNSFRVEQSVIYDTKEKALSNALGVGYIDTVHIEWEE